MKTSWEEGWIGMGFEASSVFKLIVKGRKI